MHHQSFAHRNVCAPLATRADFIVKEMKSHVFSYPFPKTDDVPSNIKNVYSGVLKAMGSHATLNIAQDKPFPSGFLSFIPAVL